ncbi:hypothetical protein D0T49_03865 [Paludibacter sp. 221]|nr:hypothetical protein [Paludibacter sp. 221]
MALTVLQAEEKRQPSPEDMHTKKWEFLVKTANLNQQQAEQVKPVFMKYEEGLWDLHKKNHPKREPKNTPPNYEELNDKYVERELKQAELLRDYHAELKEILTPETLHNYYKAERMFKRELIFEMQHNHQRRNQGLPPPPMK